MSEFEFLTLQREGPITIVTINRPEVYNALHPPAHWEFDKVFSDFRDDPSQWIAIITGAGDKAFSAGNDLKYQAEAKGPRNRPVTGFAGLTFRYDLDKPVIAAVNGFAMGGGFEIALATDIIVASENAIFALPEPRVGLAALAGGVHRLPRAIPIKRAMGMMLTGGRVSAAEGHMLGFVNEVTPVGDALDGAKRWAAKIMECSPMSIRATKQASMRGLSMPTLQDAIEATYPAVRAMMGSEDYIEGPRAFAEKRPPNWKGR